MSAPARPDAARERAFLADGAASTEALGRALGRHLLSYVEDGITLALEGDLGAGKTTFVRALARGLGLSPRTPLPSPTFTIAQRFALPGGGELYHVDAYRLGGAAELEAAGLEDMCGSRHVTCVEWAGRVVEALPADRLEVRLDACPSPTLPTAPGEPPPARLIRLVALGARSAACLGAFVAPPEVQSR